MNTSPWFATWFDTPFYHILYKNRNDKEAHRFIDNLITHLTPKSNSHILDLACGKGRHAIYLAEKGFETTGVDLSAQSINHANQFAHEKLHFDTHDMRETYKENEFDYVFNLFTSFGYFSKEKHNQAAIDAMAKNLKNDGVLVIDFMNSFKVAAQLKEKEVKTVDDMTFYITRKLDGRHFVKTIEFEHEKKHYQFQERVEGLLQKDFETYFAAAGLKIVEVFGDYDLNYFSKNTSDRLIMIVEKS
ncbi:MAG: SAM-dependent methyltransferase [Chitinophagales bacterium]